MTEIEQLKADLATIQEAAEIAKIRGFHELAGTYDMVEEDLKQKIADLEAQQAPDEVGKWKTAKDNVSVWLAFPQFEATGMQRVAYYVKHLEAKVAELDDELRCERIDGVKVRDDQKAITAEKNREKLAELTTIYNAIPPACGLARELVEWRIESVKREMQG